MRGQMPLALFAIVFGALEFAGGAQEMIYLGILRSETYPRGRRAGCGLWSAAILGGNCSPGPLAAGVCNCTGDGLGFRA